MDVRTFCTQSHVLIVAGKGGVGKTTMVAAIARMAADVGLSVLVIELEGRSGVSDAFGHDDVLDYAGAVLSAAGAGRVEDDPGEPGDGSDTPHLAPGSVQARRITPDDALIEYLADHGLRRISKRLMSSGIIDIVAGAIPGIRDILVLGKVKQIEQAGLADLVLVDAPATGHTMTFLSSASGLLDAARGGPVRAQAADVVALLTDPARCQVALVTLPEEMPVNEVVEAAYQLEDKVGISLGPIIVNACYLPVPGLEVPATEAAEDARVTLDDEMIQALDAARAFRRTREALQQEQIERLGHELPLPELRVPFAFTASIGPEELQVLADALAAGIAGLPDVEPAAAS
jgi:anion-transporting  ArsA/GET3 family ATPase